LHHVLLAGRFRSIQQYLMLLREAGEASRPSGPRCLFLLAGASIAFPFSCCSHLVSCLPCNVPQASPPLSSPCTRPPFLVSMQPPCQTSTFHRQPWFVANDPLRRFPSSALLHAVTSAPLPTPIAAGCLLHQSSFEHIARFHVRPLAVAYRGWVFASPDGAQDPVPRRIHRAFLTSGWGPKDTG
jgi:hypothetical protein